MPQYEPGQCVRYKAIGGPDSNTPETTGVITQVITTPGTIAHGHFKASKEQPRYEIKNDHTHKLSAIYEKNILGLGE